MSKSNVVPCRMTILDYVVKKKFTRHVILNPVEFNCCSLNMYLIKHKLESLNDSLEGKHLLVKIASRCSDLSETGDAALLVSPCP